MTIAQRVERVSRTVQSWLYRATGGRVGGSVFGRPVLLLTTTGRKSGRNHTVPLVYLPLEDGALVAGSNASTPERDPAWLLNVRANRRVAVQIGEKAGPYLAEVLPPTAVLDGIERRGDLTPRPPSLRGKGVGGLGSRPLNNTAKCSSEREELWARHVAACRNFADYLRRTHRTIPPIRLRPA